MSTPLGLGFPLGDPPLGGIFWGSPVSGLSLPLDPSHQQKTRPLQQGGRLTKDNNGKDDRHLTNGWLKTWDIMEEQTGKPWRILPDKGKPWPKSGPTVAQLHGVGMEHVGNGR